MYTWVIDYFYISGVIIFFLLSPFLTFKINNNLFKNKNIYSILFANMLLFSLVAICLLYLKSLHIYIIQNICFDYPILIYKDGTIPQGCYSFDMEKYRSVGWTLTAILWIVLEFIYTLCIYGIFKYIKNKNRDGSSKLL